RRRRSTPAELSSGSPEPARGMQSSSVTLSTEPPTHPVPTRTAPSSTRRTSRCRWCWSRETAGCTGSGRSWRPRAGSSCALWVSGELFKLGSLSRCGAPASREMLASMLTLVPCLPEPLSEPEIVGNSSVKEGGNTKLVCNVRGGKADLYWWKKNGELLLGSDHIQFVDNTTTLCITKATMNDSGYYACVVRNEVSQNETCFLLHVQSKWGFPPHAQEKK
ncbi:TMIG1 protein, partial [Centropus unirufus]|nr:TMIG1 protein [Centropus unirufus]